MLLLWLLLLLLLPPSPLLTTAWQGRRQHDCATFYPALIYLIPLRACPLVTLQCLGLARSYVALPCSAHSNAWAGLTLHKACSFDPQATANSIYGLCIAGHFDKSTCLPLMALVP